MKKPIIAVTMGDPAGVGPEICLRLLNDASIQKIARCVVFGDAEILRKCAPQIGQSFSVPVWGKEIIAGLRTVGAHAEGRGVIHFEGLNYGDFEPGSVSAQTGAAAVCFIEQSIEAALAKHVDAVVTGPIHKEALRAAGIPFPGHTEIFAAKTHAPRVCMFQYSEEVRASFVTTHVGYAEVPSLLSVERILDVIELTAEAMRRIRHRKPKIVVLGLNPHAGEHGLFGQQEEERWIEPAVQIARERGHDIEGPIPPDTAFIPAKRRSTDAFVCMYHDQGHIPLKALAFDSAVNVSLGLPIIRTSVDHGTACDIAWKGVANAGSLLEAVRLAALLSS
jgi:4-hydroxythreonine-4-phosphate dehydrogenase